MSFTWNAFGWLNLALDVLIVLSGLFLARQAVKLRAGDSELRAAGYGVLGFGTVAIVWAPLAALAGGIVGFCLMARAGWTTATVSAPIFCLWHARSRRVLWPLPLAAALVGLKVYGEVVEPRDLEVQTVRIEVAGLKEPVKLVHLSDLQTDVIGPLQLRARDAANAFDPDVVFFTGDVINHPSLANAAGEYLAGFKHRDGKFFVSGDVDGGYDLPLLLKQGGFESLDGVARQVKLGKNDVGLMGVSITDAFDRELIKTLSARVNAPRILLSHRPDAVFAADGGTADVVFSGHTHGGQVCLPVIGPVVTLSQVARKVAAGGLHAIGTAQVLVSRGLGWEGHVAPRVRTLCRPHLLLVELRPAPARTASRASPPALPASGTAGARAR